MLGHFSNFGHMIKHVKCVSMSISFIFQVCSSVTLGRKSAVRLIDRPPAVFEIAAFVLVGKAILMGKIIAGFFVQI